MGEKMNKLKENIEKDSNLSNLNITYDFLVHQSKKTIDILSKFNKNAVLGIYIRDIKKKAEIISAAIFSGIEFCILESFDEMLSSNINFVITDNLTEEDLITKKFIKYYKDKDYIIAKADNNIICEDSYFFRTKFVNEGENIWIDISYKYIKEIYAILNNCINRENICFNIDSENEYILPFLVYILKRTKGSMQLISGGEELQKAFLKESDFTTLILTSNQLLLMLENNKEIEKDIIVLNDIDYINFNKLPIKSDKNLLSVKTFINSSIIWEIKKIGRDNIKSNNLFDNIDLSVLKDSITLRKGETKLVSPYQVGLITLDYKKLDIRPVNHLEIPYITTNIIGRKSFNQTGFEFLGYLKRNELYDSSFITTKVLIKLNYIKGAVFNVDDNNQIFVIKKETLDLNSDYTLKQKIDTLMPNNRLVENISIIKNVPFLKDNSVDFTTLKEKSLNNEGPKEGIKKVENKLQQIVAEILKMDQTSIDKDTNFFDIGGNSLSVIYLLHAIDDTFKEHLTIKQIFSYPTVEGISMEILNNRNTEYDYTNSKIIHEDKNVYDLSPAERQMYSIFMREPRSTAYNLPFIVKIDKRIKNDQLVSAINTVYKANDTLHTKFVNTNKGIFQKVIADPKDIKIPIVKIAKDVKDELRNFIAPFDLESGCLIRSEIAVDTNGKRYLLLDFHHIAVDGVSLVILFKELALILKNQKLPQKSITYGDYSDWISKKNLGNSKIFWEKCLSDTKHLMPLRTDYSRVNNSNDDANTINKKIDSNVYDNVRSYCRKKQITEFMFWMSMFGLTLLDYNKTEDIVIGTPIANRNSQTQNLVGMFVNVLPISLKINKNMDIKTFIENVKDVSLGAFANSFYQVDNIVSDLGLSGSRNASPLFQASFSMQNMIQPNDELENLDFLSIPNENTNDLTAFLFYKNNIPTFSISYKTSLYSKKTVIKILNNMMNTVDFSINNDNKKIIELFDKNHFYSTSLSMKDIEEDKNLSNLNFDF